MRHGAVVAACSAVVAMHGLSGAGVGVAVGVAVPRQERGTANVQEGFQWRGAVRRGDAIEVKGVSGDIRAVRGSGPDVEVVAVMRGRSRDFDEIAFDAVEHGDGVTICALYPPRRRHSQPECERGRWRHLDVRDTDVDVDFEVRVPAGVRFIGRTISGDVDARGMEADVTARTVSGRIDVSTAGLARASAVSGSIRVSLGRSDWEGELAFTTVSGDIWIDMPGELNTEIEFSAVSGDIESDFAIVMRDRSFFSTSLRGRIGSGGRSLVIKTVSGDVRLARRRP